MKTQRGAEILLAGVIIARSTSLIFSKTCMQSMEPFNLLAVRFSIAFILLAAMFFKRLAHISLKTLLRGGLLGLAFFVVMTAESFGLRVTATSTTALLENTAIVFVPLFAAVFYKRRPSGAAVVSALIAFAGVALIALRGGAFHISAGMLLCLLAAVLYALSILLTDRLSHQDDPLALGILQVGFIALFSIAATFLFETPALPKTPVEWGCVLELAVVCSGFGFALQPVAQSGTTPERAGLFCALNPAVAAVLGCAFMQEKLGLAGFAGAALILSSILVSKLLERSAAMAPPPRSPQAADS